MTSVVSDTAPQTDDSPTTPAPERPDFPFYDDSPASVSPRGWLVVIAATAVAGAADILVAVPWPAWLALAVRAYVFVGVALGAYALVVGRRWTAIFRPVGRREVRMWFGFAALNVVVTFLVGQVLATFTDLHANPMADDLAGQGVGDRVGTFLAMVPQLFGEEVFTILLLVATLALLHQVLHLPRRTAVVLATTIATLAFAALHLPTYGGNVLQCLLVIGTARVILLVPFLRTKNIWASTGAHVLNDWTLFGMALLTAGVA